MRILVIEDNSADYFYIKTLIEEYKNEAIDFTWKTRLNEGIEELKKSDFNLILLDLGLPDANGLETYMKMKENAKDVPIVVLTGFQEEYFAIVAVRSGAIDYITKNNLNPDILRRVLKYGVEYKNNLEAINKSKETFQKYFDYSPDVAIVIDCNTGIIYDINFTAFNILGVKKKPNIGRHYSKIFPNTKLFDADFFLENIKNNGAIYDSVSFPKAKGESIFVDISASLIPWGLNKAILVTIRPAEKRIELEKCLIEINHQIDNFIQNRIENKFSNQVIENLKVKAFEKIQQAKDEITKFSETEHQMKNLRNLYFEEIKKINPLFDLSYIQKYEDQFNKVSQKHLQNIFFQIDTFVKSLEILNFIDMFYENKSQLLKKDKISFGKILSSIEQMLANNPIFKREIKINYEIQNDSFYYNNLLLRTILSIIINLIAKLTNDDEINIKVDFINDVLQIKLYANFTPNIFELKPNTKVFSPVTNSEISINTGLILKMLCVANSRINVQPISNNTTELALTLPYEFVEEEI